MSVAITTETDAYVESAHELDDSPQAKVKLPPFSTPVFLNRIGYTVLFAAGLAASALYFMQRAQHIGGGSCLDSVVGNAMGNATAFIPNPVDSHDIFADVAGKLESLDLNQLLKLVASRGVQN